MDRRAKVKAEIEALKKKKPGIAETLIGGDKVKLNQPKDDGHGLHIKKDPKYSDLAVRGLKGAAGGLAALDNLKWAALTKDRSILKELDNIGEDFPDSVLQKGAEGHTFLENNFGADKDAFSTKAGGFLLDMIGPGALAKKALQKMGIKAAEHIPLDLGQTIVSKYAKSAKVANARKFLERELTEKGFEAGKIGPMLDAIHEDDLYKMLKDPKALQEHLAGKFETNRRGSGANTIVDLDKREGGEIGKYGRDLFDTMKRAQEIKGGKISRQQIITELMQKKGAEAKDGTKLSVDPDKFRDMLRRELKMGTERVPKFKGAPPEKPGTMPGFESELFNTEKKLSSLTDEAAKVKAADKAREAEKAEREAAEKTVAKENEKLSATKEKAVAKDDAGKQKIKADVVNESKAEEARRNALIEKTKAERAAAEVKAAKENEKIGKKNSSTQQEILDLLLQKKMKNAKPKPMDEIPVPKKVKGLPDYPAKEVLDIKKQNKVAKAANEAYLAKDEIPSPKSLDSMIKELEGTLIAPKNADDFSPPPLHKDMFGDLPKTNVPELPNRIDTDEILAKSPLEVEVPPAGPKTGRSLEEILADIQNTKNSKAELEALDSSINKTNSKVEKDFARKSDNFDKVEYEDVPVDHKSDPTDLLKLRYAIDTELKNGYKNLKGNGDWNQRESDLRELRTQIDKHLNDYADSVDLPEGNAGEIFRKQNAAYGARKDLNNMVASKSAQKARKEPGRLERLLPIAGGTAAGYTAAHLAGATNPAVSLLMGAGTGIGADIMAGKIRGKGPETMANFWRNMEDPLRGGMMVNALEEGAEAPFERKPVKTLQDFQNEGEEIDWESFPEEMRPPNYRKGASVEEIPQDVSGPATDIMAPEKSVEQKMEERLNPPPRPLFDPFVNEQILNTPLPRNSQRILENPTAVKAKLAQLAPQYLPMLEDTVDKDPEQFKQALPKIAMMFPDAFEKDDYGLFDGKLSPDPMMQQKFFHDLEADEGLDSIEKAEMAIRAHRGQPIHGEQTV